MVINNSSLNRSNLARLRRELLESGAFLTEDPVEKKAREEKKEKYKQHNDRKGKTPEMVRAEKRIGRPIEEILDGGRHAKEVARELGITLPTVSNWRKRLGITSDYFLKRLRGVDESGGSEENSGST